MFKALLLAAMLFTPPADLDPWLQQLQRAETRADAAALRSLLDPGALSFQPDGLGRLRLLATPRQWAATLQADGLPLRQLRNGSCLHDICVLESERDARGELLAWLRSANGWRLMGRLVAGPGLARADDEDEIRAVLERKFLAMDRNDPALLAQCYHPRAMSYYADAGPGGQAVAALSISEWVARFAEDQAAGRVSAPAQRRIEAVASLGDVAWVRFSHRFDSVLVTDMALLARLEEGWRIVVLLITDHPSKP